MESNSADGVDIDPHNLIVNYLPPDLDDAALKNIFTEHGEVVQANIARNKTTGASLSYGFVRFLRTEDACEAIEAKNGCSIGNKKIKVSVARPKPRNMPSNRKLFVSKLPLWYTESKVEELFSRFGDIIECRLLMDSETNVSRGSAFVQYNLPSDCERALAHLHNSIPPGATSSICVYYARPPPGLDVTGHVDTGLKATPHSTSPPRISTWSSGSWVPAATSFAFPAPSPTGANNAIPIPYGSTIQVISPQGAGPGPLVHHQQHVASYTGFFPDTPTSTTSATNVMDLREVGFQMYGLPPFTTVGMVLQLLEQYGHVTAVVIDHALQENSIVCVGTGW
eukprot:CAMPEP_0185032350 /NCGR_PEP_ID=MMETSP1103-20130426/20327_1 /TAXON_ID=36769 /ORGANISM="Paraphysomonas bandaiensis, Strain Caron Lab Isolate" /LENGTH=337 /DNA_ID=CAMNT_0027568203 /DNA_START=217 /DNA_END=1227 /DNA_ORIENTATION=+